MNLKGSVVLPKLAPRDLKITNNGKEMPVGSYLWTIEIGEIRKGMLNLIRKQGKVQSTRRGGQAKYGLEFIERLDT